MYRSVVSKDMRHSSRIEFICSGRESACMRAFINARFSLFGCTSCGTFRVVPFFSLRICTIRAEVKGTKEEGDGP